MKASKILLGGLVGLLVLESVLYLHGLNKCEKEFESTMKYLQAEYKSVETDLTYCIAYMNSYGEVPSGYEELVQSIVDSVELEEK